MSVFKSTNPLITIPLIVIGLPLAVFLGGVCGEKLGTREPSVVADTNGCQYLESRNSKSLTPRIGVDGKIICEARP